MFPAFSLPALLVALVASFSPGIVRDAFSHSLARPHPLATASPSRSFAPNHLNAVLDALEGPVVWHHPSLVPYESADAAIFALVPTVSYASTGSLLTAGDDVYATCVASTVTVSFEPGEAHTPFMIASFQSDYSGSDFGTLTYDEHAFPAGVSFLLTGNGMPARVTWTLALFIVFLVLLNSMTADTTLSDAATSCCSLVMIFGVKNEAEPHDLLLLDREHTTRFNAIDHVPVQPVIEPAPDEVIVIDDEPTLPEVPASIDDLPVPPITPVVEPACGELLDDDEPTFPFAGEDDIPIGPPAPIQGYTIELEHVPRGASAESFDTVAILLVVTHFFYLANDAGIQLTGSAPGMQETTQLAGTDAGAEGRRRREEARRLEVQTRMAATAAVAEGVKKNLEPANVSLTPAVAVEDITGYIEPIDTPTPTIVEEPVASTADFIRVPDVPCIADILADGATSLVHVAEKNPDLVALLNGDVTSLAALDLGGPSHLTQKDMEPDAPEEPRCRSSRERTSTAPGHLPSAASRPASPAPVPRSMVSELGPQCLAALDLAGARKLDSDEQPSSPRTRTTTAPGYIPWAPARAPAAPVVPHALTPPPTAYARPNPYLIYETPRLEVIYETSGTAPRPPPACAPWLMSDIIYQTAPAPVVRALAARW
ncbi:hypothetical protein C8R43DRAFT_20872 [Mycena crocata]|nr:hypothetical protein C8R43DRAFT_20872 [Mycena crocata]